MSLSIKYLIECIQYFFISMNITPDNINRKINLIIQTTTKSIDMTNNKIMLKIITNISNNINNLKLEKNEKICETEMLTYSSNLNEIEEYYSFDDNINIIEKNINSDDILDLYVFLLDDKINM